VSQAPRLGFCGHALASRYGHFCFFFVALFFVVLFFVLVVVVGRLSLWPKADSESTVRIDTYKERGSLKLFTFEISIQRRDYFLAETK
jgi:hypothetical protein